jgi:hypothetical protein
MPPGRRRPGDVEVDVSGPSLFVRASVSPNQPEPDSDSDPESEDSSLPDTLAVLTSG